MVAMQTQFDVLVRGGLLTQALQRAKREVNSPGSSRLRLWTNWSDASRRSTGSAGEMFIVSGLRDLTSEPELSAAKRLSGLSKRFLLFMGNDKMPAESIAESLAELGVRNKERLHLARPGNDNELPILRRFVTGLLASDQDGSIMDAWWDRDELVVISPTFQRLRVPVAKLPKLRHASLKDRAKFAIDLRGDFIYWPSHDLHMGWAQFQQAVDPQARLAAMQKDAQFNQRYGRAIRALRERAGLSQQAIAGLDERSVRRIEQGKTRATANALGKLAQAHGMTAVKYMAAVAELLDQAD